MDISLFHKLAFMMVFMGENFDPPVQYSDAWLDWLSEASGQMRCIGGDWQLQDIDFPNKEIVISYSGEDAHSGEPCRGIIYTNFDGEVREVEPW